MTKQDKKLKSMLQLVMKSISVNFGPKCKTTDINCPACRAYRLKEYADWYLELID